MKKTLLLFTVAALFTISASAQSDKASENASDDNVNVEKVVAEPVVSNDGESSAGMKDCNPSAGKSCCQSKDGKKMSHAGKKSCCMTKAEGIKENESEEGAPN